VPRFRTAANGDHSALDLGAVRRLAAEAVRPAHFFVASPLRLQWEHAAAEEIFWELFHGRLLDPAHTRQKRTFEAWNIYLWESGVRSAEPLLALKLDAAAGRLYVARGVEVYAWEGYDAGAGVILSRQRRKWARELVGAVHLERFADADEFLDELICLLFHAVVGAGRLPLTSAEAPLPAFAFGRLLYCYDAAGTRFRTTPDDLARALADPRPNRLERAKLLETFLHAVPFEEMTEAVTRLAVGAAAADLTGLLRTLFNEVSLSPYTDLVDKTLAFLDALERGGLLAAEDAADFLSWLLRMQGRHLTAYDLVVFHHRGANYPDALLLDAVLKAYLARVERAPGLFLPRPGDGEAAARAKRRRRRALRQGWLLRRRYEGWPVPDLPTSPGENTRVLPPSHPRVPEEQILHPGKRTRRLYADDPLTNHLGPNAAAALWASAADLAEPEELRELGAALFLDRPLGAGKAPAEPDGTLLLASEAFSRSVAERRLHALAREPGLFPEGELNECLRRLKDGGGVVGLPTAAVGGAARPGVVSLTDARRAAPDFVFLRTTPGSVHELLGQYDFAPLAERLDLGWLLGGGRVLLARDAAGTGLLAYDGRMRPRLELRVRAQQGYVRRAGREYPAGGLEAVRVWEEVEPGAPRLADLRAAPVVLPPRA
jgi:hypothetical protein